MSFKYIVSEMFNNNKLITMFNNFLGLKHNFIELYGLILIRYEFTKSAKDNE